MNSLADFFNFVVYFTSRFVETMFNLDLLCYLLTACLGLVHARGKVPPFFFWRKYFRSFREFQQAEDPVPPELM